MKFGTVVLVTVGSVFSPIIPDAFTAQNDAGQANEIVALEKKLAAARDELAATKTALAIAQSQTQAAESRVQALSQTDSQVVALRSEMRLLERDLQSATAALKQLAADKAAVESALAEATKQSPSTRSPGPDAGSAAPAGGGEKIAGLQAELKEIQSRLGAAENTIQVRDKELAKLRPELATAREFESRVRELEAEKADFINRTLDTGASKEELARVTAAQADAERRLAAALEAHATLAKERDELRTGAAKAGELEARVRQLEAEKVTKTNKPVDASGSQGELARLAEVESKLAMALRSFTLLTKERDELRARVAELSAKLSSASEKR